jgi:hypothetical protein
MVILLDYCHSDAFFVLHFFAKLLVTKQPLSFSDCCILALNLFPISVYSFTFHSHFPSVFLPILCPSNRVDVFLLTAIFVPIPFNGDGTESM